MLPAYMQEFIQEMTNNGRKPSSIKRYSTDLTIFLDWLQNYKADTSFETFKALSENDIAAYFQYLSSRNYSDDTRRRLISVLNRLLVHFNKDTSSLSTKTQVNVKRDLNDTDFVSAQDWTIFLNSAQTPSEPSKTARNYLIDRNVFILILIRKYGLTPSEIYKSDMNDVNFAQQTILVRSERATRPVTIAIDDMQFLLKYFNSIPKLLRPRYRTTDPLFVAYFNQTSSFHYDYHNQAPKRLSVRAIQKMIKDEAERAGLRNISATKLRNTCILDKLQTIKDEEKLVSYFGFSQSFSLRRYKKYIEH